MINEVDKWWSNWRERCTEPMEGMEEGDDKVCRTKPWMRRNFWRNKGMVDMMIDRKIVPDSSTRSSLRIKDREWRRDNGVEVTKWKDMYQRMWVMVMGRYGIWMIMVGEQRVKWNLLNGKMDKNTTSRSSCMVRDEWHSANKKFYFLLVLSFDPSLAPELFPDSFDV